MRQYAVVSGLFFTLLGCVQLVRLFLRWPVTVASFAIPLWFSAVAVIVLAGLATWAFRVRTRSVAGG